MSLRTRWRITRYEWNGTAYVPESYTFRDEESARRVFNRARVTGDTPQIDLFEEQIDRFGSVVIGRLVERKD